MKFRLGLLVRQLLRLASAAGSTGVGYKTFVIGHEYTKEQWAMYECLTAYCVETWEWTELKPCKKEEGTEYWITTETKEITKTVYMNGPGIDNVLDNMPGGKN